MTKTEKLPSGNYRTRVFWTENGVKHSRSFTDKNKAVSRNRASEFEMNITHAEPQDILLSKAMSDMIENKKNSISPTTYKQYKSYAKNYLLDLQKKRVCEITNPDIQAAFNYEAGRHSPKTVRNIYSLFSMVIKTYRPEFRVEVRLPQVLEKESEIPTEHEFKRMVDILDLETVTAIILAGVEGMRKGEVLGLKWSNVDLTNKTIYIEETIVRDINGSEVHKCPKTRSGRRTIPLLPPAEKVLIELKREAGNRDYVIGMSGPALSGRFRRAVRKLGLEYTFHELRHFACSVMISQNVPNKYIAGFLGHETERMVERVYGHRLKRYDDLNTEKMVEYYTNNSFLPDGFTRITDNYAGQADNNKNETDDTQADFGNPISTCCDIYNERN